MADLHGRLHESHCTHSILHCDLSMHHQLGMRCITTWTPLVSSFLLLSGAFTSHISSAIQPSVLRRCWLGSTKHIWPVKNWVVGCWHGYLSGARCRLAYGPADATATNCLLHLASVKSRSVLPFWYRLTRVVLDKWPLNGCVNVFSHSVAPSSAECSRCSPPSSLVCGQMLTICDIVSRLPQGHVSVAALHATVYWLAQCSTCTWLLWHSAHWWHGVTVALLGISTTLLGISTKLSYVEPVNTGMDDCLQAIWNKPTR